MTENKTRYRNKVEYELTMTHSRRLMFSTNKHKGIDRINPAVLINRLVPDKDFTVVDRLAHATKFNIGFSEDRDKYFLSHLKTGYYQEIYRHILRYKEIEGKYDKIKQVLKNREMDWSSNWNKDEIVEITHDDDIFQGLYAIPDRLSYGFEELEPIGGIAHRRVITYKDKTPVFKQVIDNPQVVKEYVDLKYDIIAKVYGLLGMVINGTPLDGDCEACPLRHIKIEG